MKIAIFLKNNELTVLHGTEVDVVIFNIQNGKVVGVENISLGTKSQDAIVSWLHSKSINQIYLLEIDDEIHHKIKSQGIQIRTLAMLKDDNLYNTFAIFPSIKENILKVS